MFLHFRPFHTFLHLQHLHLSLNKSLTRLEYTLKTLLLTLDFFELARGCSLLHDSGLQKSAVRNAQLILHCSVVWVKLSSETLSYELADVKTRS